MNWSKAISWDSIGKISSDEMAHGPSHFASSGLGCASRNKPAMH